MVCCRKISLGTICRTARDGADDFGDSQRKKFLRECWKYHDIGSTNSGYSVLHVQSGRCFRSNNDYTVQQRDSNTCYLFWNQYEQYHGETRMRGDMVSATSR